MGYSASSLRALRAGQTVLRPLVLRWQSLTLEIARELYRAREALSNPGARTDLVQNGTRLTWGRYLEDVSLPRTTAHVWLERYDPKADGQDAREMLLNIEAKIGELASQIPQVQAPGGKGAGRVPSGLPAKHDRLGLAQHRMKQSETIHRHPEAVARVIAEAKENEDIPTKTAVLQRIRLDHLEKSAGKQRNKPEKDISEVALILLRELGDVVAKLPALWKERAYLPEPLQESIIDAIEKLHSIMEAEA